MEKNKITYKDFIVIGEANEFLREYPMVKERIINIETVIEHNAYYSFYRLWYWE